MTDEGPEAPGHGPVETTETHVTEQVAGRDAALVWRHAASAAYVESTQRVVVADLDHPDLPPYVFEGSAAQVWMSVDGDRSEAEIVTDLAHAHDAPAEAVGPDVRHFVDRLRDLGLIVPAPVAGADD